MASRTAADRALVRAGYWFSKSEIQVNNINSSLFTHLYAGFAKVLQYPIPPGSDVIKFPDETGNFETFPKTIKAGTKDTVKALLSIGGEGADEAIASVVGDVEKGLRDRFIRQSIDIAKEHNYDGLDLCWMYRPSTTKQWEDLVVFLQDWRRNVEKEPAPNKLLLTATVSYLPPDVDGHVGLFKAINDNLDWINVLAIDFYTPDYSSSPQETGPVHAWKNPDKQDFCGSAGIQHWIDKGVAAQQLVLGLPFYGYQWTLKNEDNSGFFAPADRPDPYTNPIPYRKIPKDYETCHDGEEYVATYSHKKKTWIGHDDKSSISAKLKQAIGEKKLGGYFAWNLDGDDYDDHNKWTLSNAAFDAWPPESHP